jgi:hypothetical protein
VSAGDEVRVRYGRSRLTVAPSGPLDRDDALGRALDSYERGEPRAAAAVARAYLRDRITDHSPSFSWRGAKISELIPLVTGVSADPRIEAESSRELADALLALRTAARRPAAAPRAAEPAAAAPIPPAPPAPPSRPARAGTVRRWVPVVGLLVCVAALAWGIVRLVDDGGSDGGSTPTERADTAAAATAVADSMDYVFSVYDLYVGGLEPALLERAVRDARATLAVYAPALGPGGELEPDGEEEQALASAESYVDEESEFLDRLATNLEAGRQAVLADDEAIYRQSVRLARQAEQLEDEILSLGSGSGDDSQSDHYRPLPPD